MEKLYRIKGLTLAELEAALKERGEDSFHARQIFSWIYKKGVSDFSAMSDLSVGLRRLLEKEFSAGSISLAEKLKSADGTQKLLLRLKDANLIEAVIIPAQDRVTGCVSTQVGCKYVCRFCASGMLGFKRNLTTDEMVEEALFLKSNSQGNKLTHLVFMGIGEPLDNYDNLLKAIRIINSPDGLNIGARRITISTAGVIGAIERLSHEKLQVELSVSLHAADDKTRSLVMPINKIYPLAQLVAACRKYIEKKNRQITFEYILIKGINSDLPNARRLGKILSGLNCKVNLIPANPVNQLNAKPPDKSEILSFKDALLESGINATLRRPRGEDIRAACGQLRLAYEKK